MLQLKFSPLGQGSWQGSYILSPFSLGYEFLGNSGSSCSRAGWHLQPMTEGHGAGC